jgi:hypothetical protein
MSSIIVFWPTNGDFLRFRFSNTAFGILRYGSQNPPFRHKTLQLMTHPKVQKEPQKLSLPCLFFIKKGTKSRNIKSFLRN